MCIKLSKSKIFSVRLIVFAPAIYQSSVSAISLRLRCCSGCSKGENKKLSKQL